MSGHDAYEEEMGLLRAHDIDDPDFSSLVEEVRSAYLRTPEPSVEDRHLSAIVEQARLLPIHPIAALTTEGSRRSTPVRLIAKLAVAAVGLGLVTGGLALAGINLPLLPDGAREAVSKSHSSSDTADKTADAPIPPTPSDGAGDAGKTVAATVKANLALLRSGEISGCEFGAIVSAAARGLEPDASHCKERSTEDHAGGSDTAQRVQIAIETHLPSLQSREISGCEFGAIASAAARGIEPNTSKCARAGGGTDTEADAEQSADRTAKSGDSTSGKTAGGGETKAQEANTEGQAKGEEASGGKASPGGRSDKH